MSSTNSNDWQITGVFDPDTGVEFSYTVGLVRHGLPELHIWNQPTDGADPGAGWRLSMRDMQGSLNRLAGELVEGERAVGDRWTTKVDNGLTTIHWHLDEPVDRDELDAFGVAEGALVAPLRWELERTTITPPPPAVQGRVFSQLVDRLACLPGLGKVASDHAALGPAAAAVAEARRVARGVEPMAVVRSAVGSDGEDRWFGGTLAALLEAAGREAWVQAARDAARDDARLLTRTLDDPDDRFVASLTSLFESVLRACYLAVAAADLLPQLEASNGVAWADLAPNLLRALADPLDAELALGERVRPAYALVDRAEALADLGDDIQRAAWSLAWWGVTRHGVRLHESRWMDEAEDAGCTDNDTLGAAAAVVGAWAVAAMTGAPTRLTDAIVPFVDAMR